MLLDGDHYYELLHKAREATEVLPIGLCGLNDGPELMDTRR